VTVAAGGVPSAFISTTTVAGPPSVMVVLEGGGQEALAGTTVASAIRVRVEDAFTNVISGGTVSWTVIEGSGEVAAATSPANGSGEATAPAWTLGRTFGTQALRAQQDGAVADISAEVQSDYVLNVVYEGTPPNASVQQAFTNAVNRIKGIIVAEMSQVQFPANFNATACVAGLTINGELIPGLRIYATVEAIDGPGGVLGSAGPCYTRASNSLTVVGRMRFDSADLDNLLANGTLEAVILHEMLHVIGIGTLWEAKGLAFGTAPGSTPLFTGTLATAACQNDHDGAIFCSSGVPREDCLNLSQSCGGGTINSHWKESVFRTELMTGYLNAGLNPFSKMTIQSLADLGYGVHLVPLDAYVIPPPALMSPFPAWSLRMGEPSGPIAAVDANGNITHVYPRRLDDQ
jgi:hypothetical protein